MKAKGGRVMLQRSLCRPKFSSQVRSPQTSQKNKQDLTTRPAHSRPIARRGKSPRPWRWVMVSPVMIDGYHGGQRRMRISNTVIYPGHHTLTSVVVSRWASRLASCHDDFNRDDFHWHPEFTPFHTTELRQIETHGVVAVACFPLLTVTLHKWLTRVQHQDPRGNSSSGCCGGGGESQTAASVSVSVPVARSQPRDVPGAHPPRAGPPPTTSAARPEASRRNETFDGYCI
jgi:hypothetical protein